MKSRKSRIKGTSSKCQTIRPSPTQYSILEYSKLQNRVNALFHLQPNTLFYTLKKNILYTFNIILFFY